MCGGTYEGNYFQPTVIADVTSSMAVFQEELFGPVASVIKAKDADDAIKLANNTRYGLTSAVITAERPATGDALRSGTGIRVGPHQRFHRS